MAIRKRTPKKRTPKKRTPAQIENRKKVFRLFEKLAVGAVKIWLSNKGVPTPYIVAVDQVDEFIKSKIENAK